MALEAILPFLMFGAAVVLVLLLVFRGGIGG